MGSLSDMFAELFAEEAAKDLELSLRPLLSLWFYATVSGMDNLTA